MKGFNCLWFYIIFQKKPLSFNIKNIYIKNQSKCEKKIAFKIT